jgi:AcrR family transcriptional regulator
MFTKTIKPAATAKTRRRGRPPGPTKQGLETRAKLYETALRLIRTKGYERTTLRAIAKKARVSVGLLYRYFPNKQSLVLALYEERAAEYAARGEQMKRGLWGERFMFLVRQSLDVLEPYRSTLAALFPVLVADAKEGLFAPRAAPSRKRVEAIFARAVLGATDAPAPDLGGALARLLYLLHLATTLVWMLDQSPSQRATREFVTTLERALPIAAPLLATPLAGPLVDTFDRLLHEALFAEEES